MNLLGFSLWVASWTLLVSGSPSNPPEFPVKVTEATTEKPKLYDYMLLVKTLMQTLSYDDFCALLGTFRGNEEIDRILKDLNLEEIDQEKVWDMIHNSLGCNGTDGDKAQFKTLVKRIARLGGHVNEGLLKIMDGFRSITDEL